MGEVVPFNPKPGKIEDADIVAVCFLDHDMVPIKSFQDHAWYGVAGLWIDEEKKDIEVRLFAAFMEKNHAYNFAIYSASDDDKVQWMTDEMVDTITSMLDDAVPDLQEFFKSLTKNEDDPEVH